MIYDMMSSMNESSLACWCIYIYIVRACTWKSNLDATSQLAATILKLHIAYVLYYIICHVHVHVHVNEGSVSF